MVMVSAFFLWLDVVRTRYLGNHILTKSRLQLQPPLLAGAQHSGAAVAVSLPGAVPLELQFGRERGGPVTVVRQGLQARAIGLCQKEIIRKLAKADEQCRYPGEDHELLLVFPKAPQRRQNRAVNVRQQPGHRLLQRGDAVLWRMVLRLQPAACHHGPATNEQLRRATAGEAKPPFRCRPRTLR